MITSSGEVPPNLSHTHHISLIHGPTTRHSSLYMKHILTSTQFTREQLHHIFHVAHEMRMNVNRSGGVDIMKVSV